jgi:hypothetical protein
METRLRERAAELMRALDSRETLRARIESEIAARQAGNQRPPAFAADAATAGKEASDLTHCAACATANDPDAKFCKNCGAKL